MALISCVARCSFAARILLCRLLRFALPRTLLFAALQLFIAIGAVSADDGTTSASGGHNQKTGAYPLVRLGETSFRHWAPITSVAISPNGTFLAAISSQNTSVFVWNRSNGAIVARFDVGETLYDVSFSPNSQTLAVAANSGIWLCDCVPPNRVVSLVIPDLFGGGVVPIVACALSPNGETIACQDGKRNIEVWNFKTNKRLAKLQGAECYGRSRFLRFSAAGDSIVVPGSDHSLQMLALPSGNLRWSWAGKGRRIEHFAFSADGRLVALINDGIVVECWDCSANRVLRRIEQGIMVENATLTPDTKTVIAEDRNGLIQVISVDTGKVLAKCNGPRAGAVQLIVSPDNKTLAAATDSELVRQWNLATGDVIGTGIGHTGRVSKVALTSDDRRVVSVGMDGEGWVWDINGIIPPRRFEGDSVSMRGLAVGQGGKFIAACNDDGTVRIYDAKTLIVKRAIQASKSRQLNVAFCCGDSAVSAITENGDLTVWRLEDGSELYKHSLGACILGAAYIPQRDLIAVCTTERNPFTGRQRIRIIDLRTGGIRNEFDEDAGDVRTAAVSSDGRFLALGYGHVDVKLRPPISLYEIASGQCVGRLGAPLRDDRDSVSSISFSRHSQFIAYGTSIGQIRVFDILGGSMVTEVQCDSGVVGSLVFDSRGTRIIAGNSNSTLLICSLSKPPEKPIRHTDFLRDQANSLWTRLGQSDAACAYSAVRELIEMREETVSLFRDRLKPVKGVEESRVNELINALNDAQFAVREKAESRLVECGECVSSVLKSRLARSQSTEESARIRRIIARIEIWDVDQLRAARAIYVLERIQTEAATNLIRLVARGASQSRITQEAIAALFRLGENDVDKQGK